MSTNDSSEESPRLSVTVSVTREEGGSVNVNDGFAAVDVAVLLNRQK